MATQAMGAPALRGLTLAVHDFAAMRDFYSAICGIEWEEISLAPGANILRAQWGGLTIQLCPAAVAGVTASDFRHQLRFAVPDLAAALAAGKANGGRLHGELIETDEMRLAAMRDPDGNTLELIEER